MVDVSQMGPAELAAHMAKMKMVEELNEVTAPFRPTLAVDNDPRPSGPFALRCLQIVDQHQIPHRQWLYGTDLIRGFVTLLVAPGGTGKSSLILAMALALTTNRKLLNTHIHQQCRVALLNLEDPQHEIDRRLTALAMHYNVANSDVGGRLFISPPDRGVRIAEAGPDGFSVIHPDEEPIIAEVRRNQIDVLAVDPFAETHALEENSNPAMVKAAAAWRRVAREGNCAVILAHHVRKGPVDNIDAARGAKALSDSARIGLLLSTMTEEEAEKLGIPADDRLGYVRLDDAKANLAKRAGKARWFKLSDVTLDNAQDPYQRGDEVGVVEFWEPPNVWDGMADANGILDRLAAGPEPGELYTDSRRHPATRWAGNIVVQEIGCSPEQAANVIHTWIRNGVLEPCSYADKHRNDRRGLRVNDARRPTS
jgi:AAA domain